MATLNMQLVVTVSSGQGVDLDCRDYDLGQALAEDLSIMAIRVGG